MKVLHYDEFKEDLWHDRDREGGKSEAEAIAWRRMVDENIERIFDVASKHSVTEFQVYSSRLKFEAEDFEDMEVFKFKKPSFRYVTDWRERLPENDPRYISPKFEAK